MTQTRWKLAWKFSFRATGWALAFIAAAVLIARVLLGRGNGESTEAIFASFEVVIPLIVGLNAALLFAPDDEPALELLLASPRPAVYLIYERLGALTVFQGSIALVLTVVALLITPGANVAEVVLRWLPPSVCTVGICLLSTISMRRMGVGVLAAIGLSVGMALGREVLLPAYPNLWFMIFYVDPRALTGAEYLINRGFLLAVGVLAVALVLYRMRDEEKLLGFGEMKNG